MQNVYFALPTSLALNIKIKKEHYGIQETTWTAS